jgi:predicted nucleic-acid-binding protein
MIAVDTNVLVRLLTGDEPKQEAAARRLFASETIWIAKTVLLETGWVLRSLYGFEESAIRDAFTKLLGLKNVYAEDASSVAAALALTVHGMELADALHLSSRPPAAAFVSFDKSFVQRARRAGVSGISRKPSKGEYVTGPLVTGPGKLGPAFPRDENPHDLVFQS